MSEFFPWDEAYAKDTVPEGWFHYRIAEMEKKQSGSGKTMVKVTYTAIQPAEFNGFQHIENYTLGNDEDPIGPVKGTFGYKNFMKLLIAAQIPRTEDFAALCMGAAGAEVMLKMQEYEEKDGDYPGIKNRIVQYKRIGEVQPNTTAKAGQRGPAQAAPPAPPSNTVSPQPQPAPAASQPPVQQAPPAPVTAPPPPPQALNPMPPQPQQQPPAAVPAEQTAPCTMCNPPQMIPISQYGAHIQMHAEGKI